jgi:AcrR family transcriptional regulator
MTAPPRQTSDSPGDRPRRRRLDAASRRETILEAAIPLFATAGFEQTRISDVAARVGVTEPVIFQNFGTKAELFAAALERATQHAVSYLTDLANERPDALDWVGHLLTPEHLDRLDAAPMFGVFFADAHRLQHEANIGGAMHRCVTRVAEVIAGTLRRGQTSGTIRDDTSSDTLAWLVVSLIQARQFRRTHTAELSPALENDLLAHILDAFRPQVPSQDSGLARTAPGVCDFQ